MGVFLARLMASGGHAMFEDENEGPKNGKIGKKEQEVNTLDDGGCCHLSKKLWFSEALEDHPSSLNDRFNVVSEKMGPQRNTR